MGVVKVNSFIEKQRFQKIFYQLGELLHKFKGSACEARLPSCLSFHIYGSRC